MRCAAPHASFVAAISSNTLRVVAREHRAAIDDHVDLVGAELDRAPHVVELHAERRLPARERRRDARDLHGRSRERLLRDGDEVRIDADRGARTDRSDRCRADESAFWHICRTLPAVSFPSSVVRSIIEIASFRPATFAAFLMRPLAERRGALFDRDGSTGGGSKSAKRPLASRECLLEEGFAVAVAVAVFVSRHDAEAISASGRRSLPLHAAAEGRSFP